MQFQAEQIYSDTNTVQLTHADVIASLKYDGEFFIQFFLGDTITSGVPQFHLHVWEYLTNIEKDRIAIALPRAHAKTTLAKLAVIYYFLFSPIRFCVYLSNTSQVARDAVRDIISFMETDNFIAVFGEATWEKRNEGDGRFIFDLNGKRCILLALGAGQQTRGLNIDNQRPELAVVDDLESDENTATVQQIQKLTTWFYGPFFKALDKRRSKLICIGNVLTPKSLIYKFCTTDERYHSLLYGCVLQDGQPLWPELWSLQSIAADYLEYESAGQLTKWYAEMMNTPLPAGRGLITPEEINRAQVDAVDPPDVEGGFITIDPAISQRKHADPSAIAVHAIVDGVPQIVDYVEEKMDLQTSFLHTINFINYWHFKVIGIEVAAMQAAVVEYFETLALMNGILDVEIVSLPAIHAKTERLAAWANMLKSGAYTITRGFTKIGDQLLYYDKSKKNNEDNLIDACAHGANMLSDYDHLIYRKWNQLPPPGQNMSEIQICTV